MIDLRLINLNTDVLLTILSCCGVSGVISASQTCKWMHSLAFHRFVWISLVRDLVNRAFIDSLPGQDIRELSTSGLVDLVKRAVQGPKSWSPPYSSTVSREYILHPRLQPDPNYPNHWAVDLLPGGRCILLRGPGCLLCWSVPDDALIWEYIGQTSSDDSDPFELEDYAWDVLENQNISICVLEKRYRLGDALPYEFAINIMHIDLTTRVSSPLFNPHMLFDDHTVSFDDIDICGDIALAVVDWATTQIFLVNWKLQSCIFFDLSTGDSEEDMYYRRLTTNHLVVLSQEHARFPKILVWDISSFSHLWSPKDSGQDRYSGCIGDIPLAASASLNHPSISKPMSPTDLIVHKSVIDDSYIVTAIVSEGPRDSDLVVVFTYSLSTSKSRLSSRSSTQAQPHHDTSLDLKSRRILIPGSHSRFKVTYAGHIMLYPQPTEGRRLGRILNLRHLTGAEDDGVLAPSAIEGVDTVWEMSWYSGSIVCLSSDFTVVIKYYE